MTPRLGCAARTAATAGFPARNRVAITEPAPPCWLPPYPTHHGRLPDSPAGPNFPTFSDSNRSARRMEAMRSDCPSHGAPALSRKHPASRPTHPPASFDASPRAKARHATSLPTLAHGRLPWCAILLAHFWFRLRLPVRHVQIRAVTLSRAALVSHPQAESSPPHCVGLRDSCPALWLNGCVLSRSIHKHCSVFGFGFARTAV